jgi:hypothetical protein
VDDLDKSINTLAALYMAAMDKDYIHLATHVKAHLLDLIREQNKLHAFNVRRLMVYERPEL